MVSAVEFKFHHIMSLISEKCTSPTDLLPPRKPNYAMKCVLTHHPLIDTKLSIHTGRGQLDIGALISSGMDISRWYGCVE
jgi:hypothetical protein